MTKKVFGALSVLLFGTQLRGQHAVPTTADIAARAIPATATIIALDASGDTLGQGSGFVIRSDGVIVTNYHVMRGASGAIVVLASRERFTRVRVLDADSSLDIVLLKIPGAGLSSLLTRTTVPRVGEKIIAVGSPLGLANSVTEGIVSATRIVGGHELVQISAAISPGSSGGAVLDGSGRAFAISTAFLEGGQSLNFAVPVRYALGLLNDAPIQTDIASVFAGLPHVSSSTRETNASQTVPRGLRRTSQPRTDVTDTYELSEVVTGEDGTTLVENWGYLFASRDVGLLVLAQKLDSGKLGPTAVYGVTRWATNAAGDVVLAAGGVTFDGYQTADSGFVARTNLRNLGQLTGSSWIGGVPTRLPMSRNDGLFTASVRTWYKVGDESVGDAVDWTGDLAVAFARGIIYVDLMLTNSRGGTVGFFGSGPLKDDNFDLYQVDGRRLKGYVRDGVVVAEWRDQREKGAFLGTLRAERK